MDTSTLLDIVSIESFSYWGNTIGSKGALDEIFNVDENRNV